MEKRKVVTIEDALMFSNLGLALTVKNGLIISTLSK